ncbi:MAG: enoyl-CoA hydratase/isomerase family protein [Xanthomonadales bacterium]|nr:enoyl-CoA hydratase/isomerase family protein [Xanthomonadales bacterium]
MIQLIDHPGSIRELRLERPPVNAFDPGLTHALRAALEQESKAARALVVSGRPGMFSAGLDVPALLALDRDGMAAFWTEYFSLLEAIARCPVPIAAAITGHAPAGGAVVSLFCDYRIMCRGSFVFGLNETRVGLIVPDVIQYALVRLIGARLAERQLVSGALVSPDEALDQGMVDALADDAEQTIAGAIEWCAGLLELPPFAMLGNRAVRRRDLAAQFDTLGTTEVEAFVDGWFSKETQAVLHAMVERLKAKA